jgi:hypothetical protein
MGTHSWPSPKVISSSRIMKTLRNMRYVKAEVYTKFHWRIRPRCWARSRFLQNWTWKVIIVWFFHLIRNKLPVVFSMIWMTLAAVLKNLLWTPGLVISNKQGTHSSCKYYPNIYSAFWDVYQCMLRCVRPGSLTQLAGGPRVAPSIITRCYSRL